MSSAQEFKVNLLLLVEDSDDDVIITQRKIFKSSLQINEFLVAKSLTEGLVIIKEKSVDIVLLDLNLPESRGLDTLERFRKEYKGVIIVCTSLEDELIGIEAIRRGADDYVIKSVLTETSLARAILYARERHRANTSQRNIRNKLDLLEKLAGV